MVQAQILIWKETQCWLRMFLKAFDMSNVYIKSLLKTEDQRTKSQRLLKNCWNAEDRKTKRQVCKVASFKISMKHGRSGNKNSDIWSTSLNPCWNIEGQRAKIQMFSAFPKIFTDKPKIKKWRVRYVHHLSKNLSRCCPTSPQKTLLINKR